ncbi:M48 family metalloprotease [Streptomyces sp. NPDC006733]|uniref:M48 family metallopeptidase n=1 Tax=Streptomyces sp. NPDC006733 TaxID=3155460 RepID=UPI0034042FCB
MRAPSATGRARVRSATGRALLGCVLLAGVHLLAAALLAVQLLLLIAVLTTESWQLALLGTVTVVPVSTLAYGLLAGASAAVPEGPRIELTPEEQPELWALTLRLAAELDTAAPTTLRLTGAANACAGERSRLLGLVGGPRTLDLGLPLLLELSRDELGAVLCHELGHYAGRHTRLAAVSHRGSVRLERTVRYLEFLANDQTSVKPVVRVLLKVTRAYNGVYLRRTLAVRRRQELEADTAAARIAGRAPSPAPCGPCTPWRRRPSPTTGSAAIRRWRSGWRPCTPAAIRTATTGHPHPGTRTLPPPVCCATCPGWPGPCGTPGPRRTCPPRRTAPRWRRNRPRSTRRCCASCSRST